MGDSTSGFKALGSFWLPAEPDHVCNGRVDTFGGRPTLEVVGDLTPQWASPITVNGLTSMTNARDDETDLVVHGSISDFPGKITLLEVATTGRSTLLGGVSSQTLRGDFLVLGGHVSGVGHAFAGVRIRLQGLAEWHCSPDTAVSFLPELRRTTVTHTPSEPIEYPLPDSSGVLRLLTSSSLPKAEIRNVRVDTETVLEWMPSAPWTLEEMLGGFVRPVRSFFATLMDSSATVQRVELLDPTQNKWLKIVAADMQGGAALDGFPLLKFEEAGLEVLGRWLMSFPDLTPIPHIAAGVFSGQGGYLETESLTLCAAAEGLHRRLYPEARKISATDMQAAKESLKRLDTGMPKGPRDALLSATQYLWEPGFPMRLQELALSLASVCPEIYGDVSKWKSAVAGVRNSKAHALLTVADDDLQLTYLVSQSLRWLLRVLLLQNAGVEDEDLSRRLHSDREFQQFVRYSRENFPALYPNAIKALPVAAA